MKKLIIRKSSLATILLLLLVFNRLYEDLSPYFSYVDEGLAAIGIICCVLSSIGKNRTWSWTGKTVTLMAGFLLWGSLCTVLSDIHAPVTSVILDAFAFAKFVNLLVLGMYLSEYRFSREAMWRTIAWITRLFVLIAFIFCVANLLVNINMYTDIRYGIRAFRFIYPRVGGLYTGCSLFLAIQTIDIYYYRNSIIKRFFLLITILVMISTLRSRAFAYAAIYMIGYYIFLSHKQYRFKLWHLLVLALFAFVVGYSSLRFYLIDNEAQSRAVLLRYGFKTARDYFPLGSGYATYGTFQALNARSPLHSMYGFSGYYGLGRINTSYLMDNYWPAIMGETGFVGAAIMLAIIIMMTQMIVYSFANERILLFALIFLWTTVCINSVATASFITSGAAMLILGLCIGHKALYTKDYPEGQ